MIKIIDKKGPFINDSNSTFKIMRNLFIALVPIILFSCYKNGFLPYQNGDTGVTGLFYPLIFIMLPALTGFITEFLYSWLILKKKGKSLIFHVKSSFSIFPGLFLGLILPMNTPLTIVIMGSLFATIVGKLVYGGFGHNIFNPALVGRLFVITTYAITITSNGGYLNPSELDAVTTATPLSNVVEGIGTYETLVKPYGSLMNFFIGTIPGAMGETSVILCLIGFIYLLFKRVLKWEIPVIYVATVFVMTYMIGLINGVGIWYPLFQILSGGLLFGAIFMATDPVTSPVTKMGRIIYAFMLGILTVTFRYLTPYPEGVLTSILTMNMLVFILDKIGLKAKQNKKYIFIPLIIIGVLLLSITTYIATSFDKPKSDFTIISKEKINNNTTYIVTAQGYSGSIKAKVVVTEDKVLSFEVLEQSDDFYQAVENNDYINVLVKNQYNLDTLDTVAGATFTSSALKKILISVIDDYTDGAGFTKVDTPIVKPKDFEIVSKKEVDGNFVYTVKKKSFGGYLQLEVTVSKEEILDITVLEQKDSYFDKIIEADYINTLLENQNNLENLDTVTGATVSSTSLKDAITKVLEDAKNNLDPIDNQDDESNNDIDSGEKSEE